MPVRRRGTKGFRAAFIRMQKTPDLDEELDRLGRHLPERVARFVHKVRSPGGAVCRIPLGIALVAAGLLGFLPILGFWMVPLGLAILAQDIPFLRPPLARALAWINRKWEGRQAGRSGQSRGAVGNKSVSGID